MASDADVLIKLGLDLKDVKSEIASFKEEMKKSSEEKRAIIFLTLYLIKLKAG